MAGPIEMTSNPPTPPTSDTAPGDDLRQALELRLAHVRLSRNDDRVLAFIREHLDELAFHTSESIAQGAGVSRAAVVRFAHRLGYSGFTELRTHHRNQLRTRPSNPNETAADSPTLLERKASRDAENVRMLPELIGSQLDEVAGRLARARQTWLIANRETYGLVLYFHRLLHHVRSNINLVDPSFADPLRDIGDEDVLLACTFRPYARQTLELAAHARRAGTHVVALTDGPGHRLFAASDSVLTVSVESPTMFLSFVAAASALEALAAHVARLDVDATHTTLEATDAFVHHQRLMIEPGPLTGAHKSTAPAAATSAGTPQSPDSAG